MLYALTATVIRVSVILLSLQLLLLWKDALAEQPFDEADASKTTPIHPSPKYARNERDMRPEKSHATFQPEEILPGAVALLNSTRLVLPRRLVVYADKSWMLTQDPPPTLQYVFISWHWASFKYDKDRPRKETLAIVKRMARHATLEAGLKAYWLDVQCIADEPGQSFSSDVYGMADYVRNAHHVAILLPSDHSFHKREWARRLWTLPEGLLATGRLRIWTATQSRFIKDELDRVEMTREFWRPFENDERHYPTLILAEYFENHIGLSRLELITTAIAALSRQDSSNFTQADIVYALMGLLRSKITANKEDTLFQALAKLLSLTGDNEYVIERLLSSFLTPAKDCRSTLKAILNKDQFGTYLWDIWPKCEVVGIDDLDGVVYLNDCRTLPVRLDSVPEPLMELLDEIQPFVRPALFFLGLLLVCAQQMVLQRTDALSAAFLCIMIYLALSPNTFTRGCSTAEEFALMEGTLPPAQLEHAIYGHITNSLIYSASSSPLTAQFRGTSPAWTEPTNIKRWTRELYSARAGGGEPDWIQCTRQGMSPTSPASPASPISPLLRRTSMPVEQPEEPHHPPLLPRHSLFTLIHMPSGRVSLVQAINPPTTLLLTGTEGGMLRAVLCSSMRDQNGLQILQKEAVVRLNTGLWDRGTPRSWLRVKMMAGC